MSASTSAQAPSSAPMPAHPAFPSLIPSHLRSAPVGNISPPTTPAAVLKLITSSTTPHAVHNQLIPTLKFVAAGGKGGDKDKEKLIKKGEENMALFDQNLGDVTADDIRNLAAGLVFVVSARMHPNHTDQKTYNADLLRLATEICINGDADQLNACGARLGELAWGILRLARYLRTPAAALEPIQALLYRAVDRNSLSGVHAAFLEASLLTGDFSGVQRLIYNEYFEVKQMSPSYLDVITFYHHAGLICAACKHWGKAVEMFSMGVSVPTAAASAIQLACAKRAILCGLMNNGKLVTFPKYTAGVVTRVVEKNAKEYVKLAEAFIREEWVTVRSAVATKEFKDDCNFGLLEQIISSIPIRRILKIKSRYSRMTITDLANRIELPGTEGENEVAALVYHMIENGDMRATIDSSTGPTIVTFMQEDKDYTSPSALEELKAENRLANFLEMELTRSGRELGVNREYLKKQAHSLENNGGKGMGGQGMKGGEELDEVLSGRSQGGFGGGKKMGMRGVGSNMGDTGF